MPSLALILRIAPYLIGALVLIGAVFYIYERGVSNERNENAGKVLERVEEQRQDRESIEEKNRNLDDDAATQRLRPGSSN